MSEEAELAQFNRQLNEPSNDEVINAFSRSDSLSLFLVGNQQKEKIQILANSSKSAMILALMNGHTRQLRSAEFYKPTIDQVANDAIRQAILEGVPGVVWIRKDCVIMRDRIFYDSTD
jgi:hypothetical protein